MKKKIKMSFQDGCQRPSWITENTKKAKDDLEKGQICYNHLAHIIKTNLEYRVCTKEFCFLPRFFTDKI